MHVAVHLDMGCKKGCRWEDVRWMDANCVCSSLAHMGIRDNCDFSKCV